MNLLQKIIKLKEEIQKRKKNNATRSRKSQVPPK